MIATAAALAPSATHAALASAAAMVFEATPFVLAASALGGLARRLHPRAPRAAGSLVALFGCGCGALPGALSLPAIALCWLGFGPAVALLRCAAGLAVACCRPAALGPSHDESSGGDFLAGLAGLVGPALGAAVVAQLALRGTASMSPAAGFLAGALVGALAPCAFGSVALASALRFASTAVSAGLLTTAGLVPRMTPRRQPPSRPSRLCALGVAAACAALVARHGAGFVNPRLLPLIGAAALFSAGLTAGCRTRAPGAWRAPALLLAALVLGSPSPAMPIGTATSLEDAYPGQSLRFLGVVHGDPSGTTLVRFAITCCRADAAPVAVRLDRRLRMPDGAWVEADGVLQNGSTGGLVLRATHLRHRKPPDDPFVYR